jgi:hypothetical protein
MSRVISVLCAAALFAFASPSASAQPPPSAEANKKKPPKKKKPAKKRASAACKRGESRAADGTCAKSLIFGDGDSIEGDTPNGYGDFMTATRSLTFAGLIRLRTNFHAEILKSASDI